MIKKTVRCEKCKKERDIWCEKGKKTSEICRSCWKKSPVFKVKQNSKWKELLKQDKEWRKTHKELPLPKKPVPPDKLHLLPIHKKIAGFKMLAKTKSVEFIRKNHPEVYFDILNLV